MTIDHSFFPSVQFVKMCQIKSQINHKAENKYREMKCQNYKNPQTPVIWGAASMKNTDI